MKCLGILLKTQNLSHYLFELQCKIRFEQKGKNRKVLIQADSNFKEDSILQLIQIYDHKVDHKVGLDLGSKSIRQVASAVYPICFGFSKKDRSFFGVSSYVEVSAKYLFVKERHLRCRLMRCPNHYFMCEQL